MDVLATSIIIGGITRETQSSNKSHKTTDGKPTLTGSNPFWKFRGVAQFQHKYAQ
jgi:hypothetical protein